MKPILIVEDEMPIQDLIKFTLQSNGFQCVAVSDGLAAANLIETKDFSLAILDIMVPEIDGYQLLEYLKSLNTPVMFVTAKSLPQHRIKGLSLGAEDYLVKPFLPEELSLRVKNILKHYNYLSENIIYKNIKINIQNDTVFYNNTFIKLTNIEYILLLELVKNQNIIIPRYKLFEKIWGENANFESRTLDLHINRLRKKLDLKDNLKTIYGNGFILEKNYEA